MTVLSIVLLCIGSNVDNLSAAVALGVRSIAIPCTENLLIGVVTALGTYVSMTAGAVLTGRVAQTATEIGGATLVAMGVWTVVAGWQASALPTRDASSKARHREVQSRLSVPAALALAVALAANNVISGVGAGAVGLPPGWTALASGFVSVALVRCGDRLASTLVVRLTPRRCGVLAGVMLVTVGVVEVVM